MDNDDLAPIARSSPEITLPEPELSNLKDIYTILTSAVTLHEKDKLSAFIVSEVSTFYLQKYIYIY
jgi:hypothetical protein